VSNDNDYYTVRIKHLIMTDITQPCLPLFSCFLSRLLFECHVRYRHLLLIWCLICYKAWHFDPYHFCCIKTLKMTHEARDQSIQEVIDYTATYLTIICN